MTEAEKPQSDTSLKAEKHGKIPSGLKFMLDFLPLVLFFFAIKFKGIMFATAMFMVLSVISMGIHWFVERHIPKMLKLSTGLIVGLGALTLIFDNPVFVKMKLTVINCLIAAILLVGMMRGKLFIKSLLGEAISMNDIGWRIFTRNYALFSLLVAGLNEAVWRTQSDEFWAGFKSFGVLPMMMVFIFVQMMLLMKYIDTDALEQKKADQTRREDKSENL
ncbi:inner membrane-spanning protein YciB [Temperatibacter marinus]|uniref:Inner membrane-spanning protein YciB n=1 Tax=Temperatibacter marinus TaxID=1456591 RepID=A0AA52EH63_9PROT|nr:inner membrane-spanning protein YciB [Temperatibacter marinus]WND03078.1 inner membrane-spanning protein YciB [Temperatibacter marinus]